MQSVQLQKSKQIRLSAEISETANEAKNDIIMARIKTKGTVVM